MRFVTKSEVRSRFEGKSVAIVGSGPGSMENDRNFVDSHDVVVRVNNYHLARGTGVRTDVFYSFFGHSIKKHAGELQMHGVELCMCKCPNAIAIESEWHRINRKTHGVDFRWIYQRRRSWWFCDTYIPSLEDFRAVFELLNNHVPTTGFSAILDVLQFDPKSVFLTGFDFFRSGKHNLNQPWRPVNPEDPIRHEPEQERAWLKDNASRYPLSFDPALTRAMSDGAQAAA